MFHVSNAHLIKGMVAKHNYVQYDAARPYVCLHAVVVAPESILHHFWRCKVRTALLCECRINMEQRNTGWVQAWVQVSLHDVQTDRAHWIR